MSYDSIFTAKDGTIIPIFTSGQAMYSKYAPLKEAEKFVEEENQQGFFLICGIGSAIHIKSVRNKFPKAKILAVEVNNQDIDFLEKHFEIKKIAQEYSFQIATTENLKDIFISSYNPILDGDFKMLSLRSWVNNNNNEFEIIKDSIQNSLENIASDVSTQAHFGKIWHRNIFQNLIFAGNNNLNAELPRINDFEGAVIVAPGPSIKDSIQELKNTNKYIIATDTALPILLKQEIQVHAVVTIDAQIISRQHFFAKNPNKILLVADLCGNPACIRKLYKEGSSVFFVANNHPLCNLINEYFSNFNETLDFIYSGAGTVTISALDFAIKAGFQKIELIGADFSYVKTCTYGKGSYFEDRFNCNSNRFSTLDSKNLDLFFRQPLNKIGQETYATNNLIAYKNSLDEFIVQKQGICNRESNNYIFPKKQTELTKSFNPSSKQVENFLSWYIEGLQTEQEQVKVSILPLMAWFNKKNNKKISFFSLLKLAYYQTVRYTSMHGK